MSAALPRGDFRRMAPVAIQVAEQIADAYDVPGAMRPEDDPHLDTLELAAHLLTMPLDDAAKRGPEALAERMRHFREVFEDIVVHEDLPKMMLAIAAHEAASSYQVGLSDGEHEGWKNATENAATIVRNMKTQPELTKGRIAVALLEDVAKAIERALPEQKADDEGSHDG